MELAHLNYRKRTYEDYVGLAACSGSAKRNGGDHVGRRRRQTLTAALEPDYVVLGGGNVKKLKTLAQELPGWATTPTLFAAASDCGGKRLRSAAFRRWQSSQLPCRGDDNERASFRRQERYGKVQPNERHRHPALPQSPPGRRSRRMSARCATLHLRRSSPTTPRAASASRREAAGSVPRLLEEPHHRRRRSDLLAHLAERAACASGSRRCSAARRSTRPKSAPCSTSRFVRRAATSIVLDGDDVVPHVHEVLDRMARVRRPGPGRPLARAHRPAHSHRHQYRHRRLRSRPGHGLRGAQALQRAGPDLPLRVERGRHRLRRGHARSRPRRNPVHRLLEDVHHARDDDQRRTTARQWTLAALGDERAQSAGTSSRSPPTPNEVAEVRHRHRPTCSASGTGSAAATRWTRRSGCRP